MPVGRAIDGWQFSPTDDENPANVAVIGIVQSSTHCGRNGQQAGSRELFVKRVNAGGKFSAEGGKRCIAPETTSLE
ncbi:hypothetical protein CEQ31_025915 [Serratia odorifera]|nr:hypothetical protein CEQ31_025915 [Serratia odorifera]